MSRIGFLTDYENRSIFYMGVCFAISVLALLLGLTGTEDSWVGWTALSFFLPGVFISWVRINRKKRKVLLNQNEFKVGRSSWAAISYIFLCSGWIVGGLILLSHRPEAEIVIALLIGFCAAGLFVSIWMFFDQSPLLVINHEGFFDRTLGVGIIPWDEIKGAYVSSVQGTDTICLRLKNDNYFKDRRSSLRKFVDRINSAIGFELLYLGFMNLDAAYLDQAVDFIISRVSNSSEVGTQDESLRKGQELVELFS